MRPLLLLLLLQAGPLAAQPSASAVLQAWLDAWHVAAQDVEAVEVDEMHVRTIEGPRGTLEIATRGTLLLSPRLRPRRSVEQAWVDDEPIDLEKRSHMERRLRRALGRASMDLRRPAPLPDRILASAEPVGRVELASLGSTPAWQLTLERPSRRGPPERLTAWFSRSHSDPHLLRLQRDRRLRHNDRLTRTTTYTRRDGLDLPVSHSVDAEIEQRRRLRSYTLVLHSEASYTSVVIH